MKTKSVSMGGAIHVATGTLVHWGSYAMITFMVM
jgi:hypothetical protein